MKHIEALFRTLAKEGKKAFIPYITAGDPNLAATAGLLRVLEALGADMIEVGIPFSDPMADGPVIQAAMERALKNGTTLRKVLGIVGSFKEHSSVPVILMGYFNPFLAYGIERFVSDARAAGVDAVLTVDLPPEEAKGLSGLLKKHGIAPIFLASPLTDRKRMAVLEKMGEAFIYLVSVTGVTGERNGLHEDLAEKALQLKEETRLPVVLGFGISGAEMIRQHRGIVDGFVVGSAIVKRWEEASRDLEKLEGFKAFIGTLARGCHGNTEPPERSSG